MEEVLKELYGRIGLTKQAKVEIVGTCDLLVRNQLYVKSCYVVITVGHCSKESHAAA